MTSPSELKCLLSYDPITGFLFWKTRAVTKPQDKSWNKKYAGKQVAANTRDADGYHIFFIKGRKYLGHKVAWMLFYGSNPPKEIDHKNGDRFDNRIGNLRSCTRSQNCRNAKIRSNNKSGFKGVSWNSRINRWFSYINYGGKMRSLGHFKQKDDAVAARLQAEKLHFGEFARNAA